MTASARRRCRSSPIEDEIRRVGRATKYPPLMFTPVLRMISNHNETLGLITHVFVAGDDHLDSDAVFGVRENLIGEFARHEPGTAPDGRELDVPYWTMAYDMVLAP